MKARLLIMIDASANETDEESLTYLDKVVRQKFNSTEINLPDDLKEGDVINLGDYVRYINLTPDEADAFSSWAVISRVTRISDFNGRKEVEVDLIAEEELS